MTKQSPPLDYLQELGCLALGSRLKRLSERLVQEVANIYQARDIDFEPRWFPIFRYIAETGSASITDIATAIGVTHPAVNQMAQELLERNLIVASLDAKDKRKRILSLSAKGKKVYASVKDVWSTIHASVSDLLEETENHLPNALLEFEKALDERGLLSRYDAIEMMMKNNEVEIISYKPDLAKHFVRLNRAWIDKYFSVEESDEKLFRDPGKIVEDGGEILFVKIGSKFVGTCALIKKSDDVYELGKMAVDEAYQGRSLGRILLEAAIKLVRERGAKSLTLETNSKLKAAVRLYERLGFVIDTDAPPSYYSRVDLKMKLTFDDGSPETVVGKSTSSKVLPRS
jgi:DNA-binding MarR family transcriptional regulator/GNAT superfamily N-acetyltransferase